MTLPDLLRLRGVRFRLTPGHDLQVCCPFCQQRGESEDTRFRLGINLYTSQGHCFNCGWKSRSRAAFLFLRELGLHADWHEELRAATEPDPPKMEVVSLPPDFELLTMADRKDPLVRQAMHYLATREIAEQQIRRHRIGVSLVGRYAYRIVFPIAYQGRLRMLVGRDFTGRAKARYLNSHGEKLLFGCHGKRAASVVLTEGIFKALALERVLPDNWACLAILGHDITPLQLEQLRELRTERVVVWPDPDRVGIEGAIQICDSLIDRYRVEIVTKAAAQADELTTAERLACWRARMPWNPNVCLGLRLHVNNT